ncbi:MAG: metalloregulator ArsR/SmtB family transcription factor [Planctomycetota bacterium]
MADRAAGPKVDRAAPLFAALGDPTRLGLVVRLASGGPVSISALSATASVSRQAVSKHLRVLADAGLVSGERRGREHVWRLRPERLEDARASLDRIEAQWDAALERLRRFVED